VLNDNVLKNAIIFIGIFWLAKDEQPLVIPIASALLVLPFLLFSPLAGKWAQNYSKRKIYEKAKLFEIPIMVIAATGFYFQSIYAVMFAMLLMGLQSALYSPSKYGLIRDIGGVEGLSYGIGTMELLTFLGVLLGQVVAGIISDLPGNTILIVGLLMVVLAVMGWVSSKKIKVVEPEVTKIYDSVNPIKYFYQSFKWSKSIKGLNYTVFGLGGFWLVASLLQMNIYLHAPGYYGFSNTQTSIVMALIAIGIGLGCWVAGLLSKNRVEVGMVPLGGIGLSISMTIFATVDLSTTSFIILLVVAAFFSGFYKVPLNAWLQERVEGRKLGNILAYNNMVAFAFILAAAGIFGYYSTQFNTTIVFMVIAVISWIMTVITLLNIPAMMVRFIADILSKIYLKYEVTGLEHIPKKTGALLVANHQSLLDALIIVAAVPRMVRFVMARQLYEHPALNWLVRRLNMIPISSGSDRERLTEFNEICQREINEGHIVCIFPEGQISRIGHLLEFKKGIEHIAKGINAPVIPIQMDGVIGTPFSFETGNSSPIKRLSSFRKRIHIAIGKPIETEINSYLVRQQMQELNAETFQKRILPHHTLNYFLLKRAKELKAHQVLIESTGDSLTYQDVLNQANKIVSFLKKNTEEGAKVGVSLPNSKEGLITNIALSLTGNVVVNIPNAPTSAELQEIQVKQELPFLITSKSSDWNGELNGNLKVYFVEDILLQNSPGHASQSKIKSEQNKNNLAAVIYERNENGGLSEIPITHENVLATIKGLMQTHILGIDDKLLSMIPLHTYYGYIFNVWLPLLLGVKVIFNKEKYDPDTLAKTILKQKVNVLLANSSVIEELDGINENELWKTLDYVLTGIDPISSELKEKLREGYDLHVSKSLSFTELGTLISVNTPDYNLLDLAGNDLKQLGSLGSSFGRCVPGLAVKTVNPENFDEILGQDQKGILLVKGPAISNFEGQSNGKFHDGWYITGRLCAINSNGFITLM